MTDELTDARLAEIEARWRHEYDGIGANDDVHALVAALRSERTRTAELREEIAAKNALVAELQHWIGASM